MALNPLTQATVDLIDKVMVFHHQIPEARIAAGGAYDNLRSRLLSVAQRKLTEIINESDWTFRYVSHEAVTIDTTGLGTLPAAWSNEGQQGGVWLDPAVNARRLHWHRLGDVTSRRETGTDAGEPEIYSVRGLREIITWPLPPVSMTVYVQYQASVGALTDASPGGIDVLPEQWRDSVLYEMVLLEEMEKKGNQPSLPYQLQMVSKNRFMMLCQERQGKPEVQMMPRYAGSADVGGGY